MHNKLEQLPLVSVLCLLTLNYVKKILFPPLLPVMKPTVLAWNLGNRELTDSMGPKTVDMTVLLEHIYLAISKGIGCFYRMRVKSEKNQIASKLQNYPNKIHYEWEVAQFSEFSKALIN